MMEAVSGSPMLIGPVNAAALVGTRPASAIGYVDGPGAPATKAGFVDTIPTGTSPAFIERCTCNFPR